MYENNEHNQQRRSSKVTQWADDQTLVQSNSILRSSNWVRTEASESSSDVSRAKFRRNSWVHRTSWSGEVKNPPGSPLILKRLYKIRENFKVYANLQNKDRTTSPQRRQPGSFYPESPRSNRRYFLNPTYKPRASKSVTYCHEAFRDETVGPIVTKMTIAPKTSASFNKSPRPVDAGARHKNHTTTKLTFKDDQLPIKLRCIHQEILDDIGWCITQFETVNSSVRDVAHDRLKNQMSQQLVDLAASNKNSDRNLAAYLNDFMGPKTDVKTNNRFAQSPLKTSVSEKVTGSKEFQNNVTDCSKYCIDIMKYFFPNAIKKDALMNILETRHKWGMDIFKLGEYATNRPLTSLVLTTLHDWGFLNRFGIQTDTLVHNLLQVESLYRPYLPYHNSLHAADVFISTHVIISSAALDNIFTELEVFAALYAAATHDIDHPGFTNQYVTRINSKVSALYNDQSVLEHHHVAQTLRILNTEKFNILKNLKSRDVRVFKKIITKVILATDHAHHMRLLADLKVIAEAAKGGTETTDSLVDNSTEKLQMLQAIVHCCDISNPLKPIDQYQNWVDRIMTEFFRQGDLERAKGLEPSPMCDRHITDIPNGQVGFIDHVVKPIWETLADIISPHAEELLSIMDENREFYKNSVVPKDTAMKMRFSVYTTKHTPESDLSTLFGIISESSDKLDEI